MLLPVRWCRGRVRWASGTSARSCCFCGAPVFCQSSAAALVCFIVSNTDGDEGVHGGRWAAHGSQTDGPGERRIDGCLCASLASRTFPYFFSVPFPLLSICLVTVSAVRTRTDAGCPAHHRVALATSHAPRVLATLRLGAPLRDWVRASATSSSARLLSTPLCNLHYTGLPSRSRPPLSPFFRAIVDALTPTGARLSSLYHERRPTSDRR